MKMEKNYFYALDIILSSRILSKDTKSNDTEYVFLREAKIYGP